MRIPAVAIALALVASSAFADPRTSTPPAAPVEKTTLSVSAEGQVIEPPVARAALPDGAWICDMGSVHYARGEKGDGICEVCKMALTQKKPGDDDLEGASIAHGPRSKSPQIGWEATPVDAASLPGRSTLDGNQVFTQLTGGAKGGTSLEANVRLVLSIDARLHPQAVLPLMVRFDYHSNRQKVQAEAERIIAETTDPDEQLKSLDNYAWFLAYMGEFEKIRSFFPEKLKSLDVDDPRYGSIVFASAIANYRLGNYEESIEQSKKAIELVHDSPNDTRWQLMLSELGAYGDEFFEKYSKDVYTTEHIAKWYPTREWELPFEDVTSTVGSNIDRWGGIGSVNFVDVDHDGWDDILLERKFFRPQLYKNEDGKSFSRVDSPALVESVNLFSPVADFDNDGELDMFRSCCNFDGTGPLKLLRGKGNFQFEDVSANAPALADQKNPAICGMPPLWVDYDLDGFVDIVHGNFCGPSQLYRNNGDGTFENVTESAGFVTRGDGTPYFPGAIAGAAPSAGAVGSSAGYVFGGPYPDIYIAGWGWRQLFRNNGDGTFTEVLEETGVDPNEGLQNYMNFMIDYNNDGRDDIVSGSYVVGAGENFGVSARCTCSNILRHEGFAEPEVKGAVTILENKGDGKLEDIRESTQFLPLGVMGYTYGDWNNDGFEDLVLGLGGPFLQQAESFLFYENNQGDGTFTNKTPFTAQSLWGKGHGMAFADYDHDGQLDLMLNNGGTMPGDNWPSMLLHNTGSDHHWIQVRLVAPANTNRSAVGARVEIKAGDLKRAKNLFGGTFGENSRTLHFGLGQQDAIDELTVIWPNREHTKTTLKNLAVDQAIEIDGSTGEWKKIY